MIDSIRRLLFKETYKKGIDPKDLFLVKRSGGDFSSEGRALFEVFSPRSEDPLWVVKANRSNKGNRRLAAEFERLKKLEKGIPEDLQDSLPSAVVFEDRFTGSISIETYLAGTKLSSFFLEGSPETVWKNWRSYGAAAIRWLERYSEVETTHEFRIDSDWFEREIVSSIDKHRSAWIDRFPQAEDLIDRIRHTEIADQPPLRSVPQHGDYTPGNLIAMDGRLGVIDWSPASPSDTPLMDLFHFLLSSSIYLGKGLGRNPREVFIDSRFMESIQTETRALFLQTGIPVQARLPLFRAAYWRKIEGYLAKPQVVESPLREWTRLMLDGGMEEIEKRMVA